MASTNTEEAELDFEEEARHIFGLPTKEEEERTKKIKKDAEDQWIRQREIERIAREQKAEREMKEAEERWQAEDDRRAQTRNAQVPSAWCNDPKNHLKQRHYMCWNESETYHGEQLGLYWDCCDNRRHASRFCCGCD